MPQNESKLLRMTLGYVDMARHRHALDGNPIEGSYRIGDQVARQGWRFHEGHALPAVFLVYRFNRGVRSNGEVTRRVDHQLERNLEGRLVKRWKRPARIHCLELREDVVVVFEPRTMHAKAIF